MRISKGFWIWGQFEDKDMFYINTLKKKVQFKLNSPFFEPHITLAGPFKTIDISFIDFIKNISQSNQSVRLNLLQYRFENETYRSFYIAVSNSKNLLYLRNKIIKKNKLLNCEIFNPHISLSYGDHLFHLKKELISQLPLLKNFINLTRLSIVDVDEQINQWKIIERFDFAK